MIRKARSAFAAAAIAIAVVVPADDAYGIHGDKNLTIAARECTEAQIGGGWNCTDYNGNRFHCTEHTQRRGGRHRHGMRRSALTRSIAA